MIKRHFQSFEASITVSFSGHQIHIAVEAFHDAGGELTFCLEVVDDEVLVFAYRLNESLDWFELRTGGSIAPLFQIPSSPIRTAISPQHLEGFLEQVGFHALEVVLDDLVESCLLCEI